MAKILAVVATVLLQGVVCAQFQHGLIFTNASAENNLKSDLTFLGPDAMVEMGAFTEGFTPTALNRADWAANWTALKRTHIQPDGSGYGATANLDNNNPPFTPTNFIWIWVHDRSGQWCLFSRSTWKWPNTSFPQIGLPTPYSPTSSPTAVAGSVSPTTPRIVCELVTDASGPAVTYAQWAEVWNLPEGADGKNQDADGDGQTNLYEYAFGSNPQDRDDVSQVVGIFPYAGQPHLAAKIQRGWVTGLTYSVQWSENLSDWFTTGLVTVANTAPLLEVRDANPVGTAGRRFLRARVTSPD